ncbi:CynX/NimT family MFS transporter [Pigmentiphaga sp.]|jgi:Arabinose efflux permease|uniref:MFS transporter n=1 Tax=Pigmentiphaga sp. TaxID=1977564 RepID=UPI0025DA3EF3|nr:MFS transporter [Pigmentiphaga sp.]MBX6317106.1 MFS transporter [Pigmentiphaga sp.]
MQTKTNAPISPRALTDWPGVALGITCGILVALCVGKMPPALPLLQQDLGLNLREVGWVVSLFSTIATLCAAVMGLASGRVGAWRFTVGGLCALATGGLLGAASDGYGVLLLSRILEGTGQIAIVVSVPALLAGLSTPQQSRMVLALWSAYMPLGISLALLTAPLLLQGGHWRMLWTLIAALTGICALWMVLWRSRYASPAPASQSLDWRKLTGGLRQVAPWVLALSFTFYAIQFFTVMTFLPTWAIQERGVSLRTASMLTAAAIIFNAGGSVLGASLLQRGIRGSALIITAHVVVGLSACAIFWEWLPDAARFAACISLNLIGGILPAATLSAAVRLAKAPDQMASLQGLFLQGSNLGQFAAAPLVTWAVTVSGADPDWSRALPLMATCAAIGLSLGWYARSRGL